jgi:hypothetical protein
MIEPRATCDVARGGAAEIAGAGRPAALNAAAITAFGYFKGGMFLRIPSVR